MSLPGLDLFHLPTREEFAGGLAVDAAKLIAGALGGWAAKVARDRWRTRRARAFWRPFLGADVRIVLGRFRSDGFERSGLLGVGDAIAAAELQGHLGRLGAKVREIAYSDRLGGDDLKRNLICLGGPDANATTRQLVDRMRPKVRFGDPDRHEITIRDTSQHPPREFIPRLVRGDGTSTDYGVVLRAPNPFAPEKTVLIVAGAFGHGTWAAERFLISDHFLSLVNKDGLVERIECLIEADVAHDTPQTPRVTIPPRAFPAMTA